jgi:hypothetical protein
MCVLCGVGPEESVVVGLGRPPDGIELVIAHHRICRTGVAHGANHPQHLALFRTTVNEIADKDHPPRRMPEHAVDIGISEPLQQPVQRIGMTVNVANEIIPLFDQSPPSP